MNSLLPYFELLLAPVRTVNIGERLQPFMKWAGGKRWLTPTLIPIIQAALTSCYYEPFVGGGAVFFALRPRRAVLSDNNEALVETYVAIRESAAEVVESLREMTVSKADYYSIRSATPPTRVTRAARMLYLNRTSFAGLYRENKEGEFTTPYGGGTRTHHKLFTSDVLSRASTALQGADIIHGDFDVIMARATTGDVIYCDPPYALPDSSLFTRYSREGFQWSDQVRLAAAAYSAVQRGATVLISNADHASVHNLYPGSQIVLVKRQSRVSRSIAGRGEVTESLILITPS